MNLADKLTKSELKLVQKLGLQTDLELICEKFEQEKKDLENTLEKLELSESKNLELDLNLKNKNLKTRINQKNQQNKAKLKDWKLAKQNQIRRLFLDKFLETDLLISKQNSKPEPQVYTFPTIINENSTSQTEHEATTSQISQEILVYLQSRGLDLEKAKMLIVGGFCGDILALLPMEFALEARKLVELTLENGFG